MSKINIRKRGNFYEYRIEIAKVDNKRQWLSKSGFRTKAEALESGSQAYTEYLNAGIPFKQCDLSYSDYLDYWLENYCMNNLKYNTIQTYKIIINKYLKKNIGKYKLSTITSVALNSYITDLVNKYNLFVDDNILSSVNDVDSGFISLIIFEEDLLSSNFESEVDTISFLESPIN